MNPVPNNIINIYMFLLIISIILIIMIIIYCLNNNIVEGYDQTQDCIGTYHKQYDPCSKTCGGGTQNLKFSVDIDPVSGYFRGNPTEPVPCRLERTRQCNTHNCPIDCKYVGGGEGWSNWIKNLDSNGKQLGIETRTRQISINDKYGGIPCGKLTETRDVNVDCVLSGWSSWGTCSKICGDGTRLRTRSILQQPKNGGNKCEASLEETKKCNNKPCPVDCVVSKWKHRRYWECDKPCGGGKRKQSNYILKQPKHGGKGCGARVRYTDCNRSPCSIDCDGDWEWTGGCHLTGLRKQIYKITTKSAHGGKKCNFKEGKTKWAMGGCRRHCTKDERKNWYSHSPRVCTRYSGWYV